MNTGVRWYPQYFQQQSQVRFCCNKEMEEAGCYHVLQLHAEPSVGAPGKGGLGFNHP